jgi:hypothetical protein
LQHGIFIRHILQKLISRWSLSTKS